MDARQVNGVSEVHVNSGTLEGQDATARPSRLIAEALVLRQDAEKVKERAKAMGLGDEMTNAVICVVCCQSESQTSGIAEP